MAVTKLSQIVKLNGSFRNSINLYLNLNKKEKIDSYIPTKSSLNILKRYVGSVIKNKDHSTILIGSYGKGKSHLLLILLAIVSMQRTKENNEIVKSLLKKIRMVDEETFEIVSSVWNKKGRFLPVIISGSIDDVSRSFMIALNDALKRENLMNLMPDTFFSIAEDTICRWKKEYPEVYINYEKALKKNGVSINDIKNGLKVCDPKALEVFKSVYPSLMGGEQFNPLTGSEVLPMYQSVADKLREQYGYSGIYVVFDEFSKFIEGQEKHSIGGNMKFLQDMCELANESKDTQIYMTMVAHKSIKEYGLYNTSISGFMSCIGDIDTYDEYSVVQKIMKIVTEVHADSWNDNTYNEYVDKLQQLKNDIEAIGSENRKGSCVLSFTGKNGEVIQKYYDPVDSDEGTMFRNIIEDQLESFSDLDVNVRVAILLEMIEKVMRKEE